MQQEYVVWEIFPGRFISVSVESVVDDWEGFRLLLRDHHSNRILRVHFASQVAYQCRDESDLEGEAARSTGLGKGCFYRVIHSEFVARFRLDSARQFDNLKHFAVITDNECVDVLALSDPVVTEL